MFESATDPRFVGQTLPYNEVFGGFTGNKAHSCMNGLDILDRLDANHSILVDYDWIENSLKYFTNNTWYANDQGIYSGNAFNNREYTSKIIFKDNIFVENKIATMLASYNIIDESVYVANSGQNLVSGERFLHRVYDGPATVKNSHFVGWTASNSNFLLNTAAAFKMANATFENITSDSSQPIRLNYPDYSGTFFGKNYFSGENAPLKWCTVLFDKTGSITGLPESSIVSNHPMLLVGDEATLPSWTNMYYTPRHYIHSGHSFNMGSPLPKFTVTRSKTGLPDVSFYDVFDEFSRHQMSLIVNDDFLYTYQLETLPSTKAVAQDVRDATIGDQYISRYKDFGKLGGLLVRNSNYVAIPSYTSLAALKNATTTGCYIEPQGDLYLKTVALKKDDFYLIHWTTDFAVTPLDTDGDGYTDSNEASSSRNPNSASDLNFNFSTTADNWTSVGTIASTCVGCNSSFTINSNGSDAQIIRNDLNFDANKVQTLFADLKAQVNGNFKLYWTTQDEPFYSEDKSIIQNYNNAGLRKTISFNVSTNPKWINNKIKSLRLNMINAEGTTNLYSIYGDISKDDDGDGMPNYDEALACRDPLNAADFGLNFDAPYDYNNWNTVEIFNFSTNNGSLSGNTSVGGFTRYNFLKLNGTLVPKFKLRIKASAASGVRIFWENEDGSGFTADRLSYAYYSNAGQWQELTFDVSNNTNWIGKTIKTLRIDPVSGTNINFEIDWLRSINYTDCSPYIDTDGDGYTNANETSSSRNPNSASDLNFNFNTTADNWTAAGTIASTCVGCNSSFTINSNGNDAQVIRNDLNFNANEVQTLFADLKAQVNGNFKLYWTTQDEPFYSEDKSIAQNYNNAGVRKTLIFNVSTNPKWINKTIKSLRLNMINEVGTTNLYSIYGDITKDDDSDEMSNYEEVLACRDPQNAADFSLNFDSSNESVNNWTTTNISNFSLNNGILSGKSSTNDPNFTQYNFLNLNGSLVPKIKIRIKASAASGAMIYWENEDGGFSEGRSSWVYYSNVGQWQDITFDVSNNTNWIGKTIKTLRIDPVAVANIDFEIDWLRSINYADCITVDTDGDGYTNPNEALTCRDPQNAADFGLNFDTIYESSDSWITSSISNFTIDNGILSGKSTNNNPVFYKNDFLRLNGSLVPKIKIRMKTSVASGVMIYWENEDGGFSEGRSSWVYYSNVGQWQDITFDVSNNTNWIGKTIKTLRIDPVAVANIDFEIDWLRSINYADCITVDTDGDGYTNPNEALTCRDPQNAADFGLNFDTSNESSNNWTTSNISNFSLNNGILSGTSSSSDPNFTQYNFLNLNGSLVPKIKIRIKASAASGAMIYWENEDGGFSEGRSSWVYYSNTGQWQELTFDLSTNTNWIGKTIKTLRIDPVWTANVNWEIDWIRAINYTDCSSCQSAYTAVALKTDSNWTYYGRAGSTDYLFAIEHKPSGGNTSTFTATINLTKLCDATNNVYNVSNTTTKEGVFIAGYYWNISTVGTLNGFVNMRFFPDTVLNAALDTKSNTFYNLATSSQQSSSVYFKSNNALNLPNDIRTDAKGLNYGFSPLSVNAIGTYASKDYVQFNQVTNINNSGGGLLKKVTKLNENTFSEKGILRYNATADKFEGFNGIEWTPLH